MLRKKIKELSRILREEGLGEIEVRTWWRTVRVSSRPRAASAGGDRDAEPCEAAPAAPAPVPEAPQPANLPGGPGGSPVPAPAVEADGPGGAEEEGLKEILSPMVGTFYSSPNPQSEPFVSPGTRVQTGQVICIIEAMKLMNEIEAETDGIIRKVLARDSQPVEFGQPLFLIESA